MSISIIPAFLLPVLLQYSVNKQPVKHCDENATN